MSTTHKGKPTATLLARQCWRMKKDGSLEQRGGKGDILIGMYPCDPQPFMKADQECMEICRTGIAIKAIKHNDDEKTVVISCQDWAHRESKQNPIKRIFYLVFKSRVRADFFVEIWNELLEEYKAKLLPSVSEDAVHSEESAASFGTATVDDGSASVSTSTDDVAHLGDGIATNLNLAENLRENIAGDVFDEGEDYNHYSYAQSYSDEDDLFEETQPTSEPLRFELKRKD